MEYQVKEARLNTKILRKYQSIIIIFKPHNTDAHHGGGEFGDRLRPQASRESQNLLLKKIDLQQCH